MALHTTGLGPTQMLQLMASIGVDDPAQLAELLASVGFKPPQPGGGAFGPLIPPAPRQGHAPRAAAPPSPVRPPRPPPRPTTPPTTPPPEPLPTPPEGEEEESASDKFLRALAAVEIPTPPQLPSAPSFGAAVPRGGGTVDPRMLAALLQLLGAGQGPASGVTPALGNLIGGVGGGSRSPGNIQL